MVRWGRTLALAAALAAAFATFVATGEARAETARARYIVLFESDVGRVGELAHTQTANRNGRLGFVYNRLLTGYAAELPVAAAEALRQDPRVKSVTRDQPVEVEAQTTPTEVKRTFAAGNAALDIDGKDDSRSDADIAIIDTGVDYTHPDLEVVARTDCSNGSEFAATCTDEAGTDGNGHGTHVAGIAAAIDNGSGVVGSAPGARIWSVKVLGGGTDYESEVVAGIEWVSKHHQQIEVANLSIGCAAPCQFVVADFAIEESALRDEGIVWVVAAGNDHQGGSAGFSNSPYVIDVSGIADYDGAPGAKATPTCGFEGTDDSSYKSSNFGPGVDIAAPATCIYSTLPGNTYGEKTGTSMAAPQVAGAAAVLAARSNPNSLAQVETLRNTILSEGNVNWTDTSGDGIKEPLLDMSDSSVFKLDLNPWQQQSVSLPSGDAWLEDVSCTAPSACTAVGRQTGASGLESRVLRWDGTSWTQQMAPAPAGSSDTALQGVSCTSPTACVAVGNYTQAGGHPLAMQWNGSEWKLLTVPNPTSGTAGTLKSVSCTSATSCTAVGSFVNGSNTFNLIYRLSGTTWTQQTVGNLAGATTSLLMGVSCSTASACTAVGYANIPGTGWRMQAARWSGSSWTLEMPPHPENVSLSVLYSVSCTAENACVAVGMKQNGSALTAAISARWDGTSWKVVDGPHPPGAGRTTFESVSCRSATSCIAVGELQAANSLRTLAARWDGTSWDIQDVPNPEGEFTQFLTPTGVSCSYPTACTAVGYYKNSAGSYVPLLLRRQGGPPTAAAKAATVSPGEARLKGEVNPNGTETTYQFEWGTTTSYGKAAPAAPKSIGSGLTTVAIEEPIAVVGEQTYHYRVRATSAEGTTLSADETFTTPTWKPGVEVKAPTNSGGGKATLRGNVNPRGFATEYRFEWGKTTAYGSSIPIPDKAIGSGTSFVEVAESLQGLTGLTTYHYRLVATNKEGTVISPDQEFTTPDRKPTVSTTAASGIGQTTATLNGTINPQNLSTTYQFQYGAGAPTLTVPASPASAGSGGVAVPVNAALTGLKPFTVYNYRLVATNSEGTTLGNLQTFTTKAASFRTEEAPALLKGESTGTHVITTGPATLTCKSLKLSGSLSKTTAESIALNPSYGECSFTLTTLPGVTGTATVAMGGCNYELKAGGGFAIGGGAACSSNQINITGTFLGGGYTCSVRLGPQTVTETTYKNQGTGSERSVQATHALTGLSYSMSGVVCSAAAGSNGTYGGVSVLRATTEAGKAKGLWME